MNIKSSLFFVLMFGSTFIKAQNMIEWDGIYQLQLTDFQSSSSQIGDVDIYSLHTSCGMDFSFHMRASEFIFTKNFNSKVNCNFSRNASALVAPDSASAMGLLNFARYEFDLSELYARKFRKKLYDEKGAFSDLSFFKPIYEDIQNEFSQRHSAAGKETDLGRNCNKLIALHEEVKKEIMELADFCKNCKPPKRKK